MITCRLDVDKSGVLDAKDFRDDFAATDQLKKRMYAIILEKFDFDDNKSISKTEFYDGFLLMAWIDSNAEREFHKHQLANGSESHSLGNLFHDWVLNFNIALEKQIQKLGHELNQPFDQSGDAAGGNSMDISKDQEQTTAVRPQSFVEGVIRGRAGPSNISSLMTSIPSGPHPMEMEFNYRKRPKNLFERDV